MLAPFLFWREGLAVYCEGGQAGYIAHPHSVRECRGPVGTALVASLALLGANATDALADEELGLDRTSQTLWFDAIDPMRKSDLLVKG
jgi:hypothetical protein